MEANVILADIKKSNNIHQIDQVLSQTLGYRIPIEQQTTSGEDAPQVLPVEHSEDRRQGPQPVFVEEEKEVVPWSQDPQVVPFGEELGLHLALENEGKQMAAASDPGSLQDDRDKIDIYERAQRRPVKRIVTLVIIAALMIVAAVVPITIIKHR